MKPEIIEKGIIRLAGMASYGKVGGKDWEEENNIGALWKRFLVYWEKYGSTLPFKTLSPHTMYEVSVWEDGDESEDMAFSTFVGVEVDSFEKVPFELECKTLPKNSYAFFTVKGQRIKEWYGDFYGGWLPDSGYKLPVSGGQCYGVVAYGENRFFGLEGEALERSELDVLVPLQKK